MNQALERCFERSIDYAGLFPPARLSMRDAYREFATHTSSQEALLVRSFVCPVNQLMELASLVGKDSTHEPIPICVIGTGGESQAAWEYGLEHDARHMESFVAEAADAAELIAYEVKLPHSDRLEQCMEDLVPFDSLDVFLEIPWGAQVEESLVAIAGSDWIYAKARTGGLEAEAFPSASELATLIQGCSQLDLSFKLTAGLHHPFASRDSALDTEMHGFVNVAAAVALTAKFELNRKEIESILVDKDPSAFQFSDAGLRYSDLEANLDEIDIGRDLFLSFGSCSVSEPWEGLLKMGLPSGRST